MNPMTNIKNIKKLSDQELKSNFKTSWHDQYKDSAWIFVGGLPYDLTEGDIICVFSQYGEIVNINLIRDKATGKQKGFCFLCYEDQRSTILAVDNLNSIKVLGRTIRVDHVADYKVPKEHKDMDAETRKMHNEGCAPHVPGHDKKAQLPMTNTSLTIEDDLPPDGFRLPERLPIGIIKQEIKEEEMSEYKVKVKKEKKSKKDKKSKKKHSKKKHKRKSSSSDSNDSSDESTSEDSDEDDRKKQKRKSEDKKHKSHEKRHKAY